MKQPFPPTRADADPDRPRDEGPAPRGVRAVARTRLWSRRSRTLALPALAAASALLLGGCSDGPDPNSSSAAAAKTLKAPTVEKLAGALGCKAKILRKVDDYREGACKVAKSQFVLLTFANNKAKGDWLDYSKDYGGTYLVGSLWTVVASSPAKLGAVQAKYGGSLEKGDNHMGHGDMSDGMAHSHSPSKSEDGKESKSGKGSSGHDAHHGHH